MKKLLLLSLGLAAGFHTACAFTYTNSDLLLIFRQDGFNDVEFNLGTVSNFLGRADGAQIPVTNWDQSLVRGNFNNSLAGVDVTLQAATANEDPQRRVWLTDASATGTPTDVSGSKWSQLRSKIDFVGAQAAIVTDASAAQSYVVSANLPSSYTQIASSGGSLDVITISGLAPFPVEGVIPAQLRFFELNVNNTNPKPPAKFVGTFALGNDGALVFLTGGASVPPPLPVPEIVGLTRSGDISTISFTTTNAATYRLRHTSGSGIASSITNWTPAATVIGNGAVGSLQDKTTDADRFYSVEAIR